MDGSGGMLTKLEQESRRIAKDQLTHKQMTLNMYDSFSGSAVGDHSEYVTPKHPSKDKQLSLKKMNKDNKLNSYNS